MPRTPPRRGGGAEEGERTTGVMGSPSGRRDSRGGRVRRELEDAGASFSQPAALAPVGLARTPGRTPGRGARGDGGAAAAEGGSKSPSPLPARPREFLNARPNTASPCPDDEDGNARTLLGRLRQLGENKLYGMSTLCNKVALSLALNFVAELFEDLMPWWPTTFILPRDLREATSTMHKKDKAGKPAHTFIFKPDSTFGGNGVCLVQSGDVLHALMQRKYSCAVLQEYLTRPLLIDGLKWDCRVYVLVTSISPLRVHVAREGLARFCTELYRRPTADNLEAMFSHVTNYALNKQSPAYQESEGDPTGGRGSKRSLSVVLERLQKLSRSFTTAQFWAEVDHIVAMTMLVLQPELRHKAALRKSDPEYVAEDNGDDSPCFHMLGFDILLDSNERASLLELNANPSLSTQSGGYNPITGRLEINTCAVDEAVKTAVVDGASSIISQQAADNGAGAETAEAAPYHRLDVWNHPEYLRVRQLLQRLGRLTQYSLRGSETGIGERDAGLGCARFQRFVRDAGLLTVRPARPKGGSIGTVIPALTPSIVESIFKSVISSGGKTAVRSQLEYTKLGLLLRELARHQLSPAQLRRALVPQQPAVDMLEKSTKKLELMLGTADAVVAEGLVASKKVQGGKGDSKEVASAAASSIDDSIDQAANNAVNTLGRMSQLVQELEKRRAPLLVTAGGSSPGSSRDEPASRLLPLEQRRRSATARLESAAGGSGGTRTGATATTPLRLPRTPPGSSTGARGGGTGRRQLPNGQQQQPTGRTPGRTPLHAPKSRDPADRLAETNRRDRAKTSAASCGDSNSPPLDTEEANNTVTPHSPPGRASAAAASHSQHRAEMRRQSRDDLLLKRQKEVQVNLDASAAAAARAAGVSKEGATAERASASGGGGGGPTSGGGGGGGAKEHFYKAEYYRSEPRPSHIQMGRMTWSVPELDSAPLTNYSSIDRPPKRGEARAKERLKGAGSAAPPRWATATASEMTFTTTTNAWRDRLLARGLS